MFVVVLTQDVGRVLGGQLHGLRHIPWVDNGRWNV